MSGKATRIVILERIYEYVSQYPGTSQSYIAEALGLSAHGLDGRLASMERVGLLLYEDGRRRLFPHSRHGVLSAQLLENDICPTEHKERSS